MKKKSLLILGDSSASIDIVKCAQQMNVHTIVTSTNGDGDAVAYADESIKISTTDTEALARFVKERGIDGAFCGPSEFNIMNTMKLCCAAGLPFYATAEAWNRCNNKELFRAYCIKNNVPCAKRYELSAEMTADELASIEYPVIVKPVDGCSSRGISVCRNPEQLRKAYSDALEYSASGNVLVEQFIQNNGEGFSFRYLVDKGEPYLYLMMDTYVVDQTNPKGLISAFCIAPSKRAEQFRSTTDSNVREMYKDMGIGAGVAFIQSLPQNDSFYCHDMGYRLSGGMVYKLTEPLYGINDMKMMIRYALGERICTDEELENLKKPTERVAAQLMTPLNVGTIASIEGLEEIKAHPHVTDVLQYYRVGDEVTEGVIGTLSQHFARFTVVASTRREVIDTVRFINDTLHVKDSDGKELYSLRFDLSRLD